MSDYKVISADSHSNEPAEIYERLPVEYRARAPHEETIDGERYMIFEGQPPFPIHAPNPLNEDDMQRYWRDGEDLGRQQHREGGMDVELRRADLEKDGVSAEVIYPQAVFKMFASPDAGYQKALAELYNDYHHEVFGEHNDTFAITAEIPMLNVEDAIGEAKRVAKMGYKSLSLPCEMPTKPYNHPDYEPFWDAAEDLGIPLAFHVFTSGPDPAAEAARDQYERATGVGEDHLGSITGMAAAMGPTIMLIASNVLGRHPNMNFVLVEPGVGWLAWVLQCLDELHEKRHMWAVPHLELPPSDYFKRQGYATFGDDLAGLLTRDITGSDCLMWGSDYPHDEGTFPHSREVIERIFKDIPEDEKRKIVAGNAARLYGFSLS